MYKYRKKVNASYFKSITVRFHPEAEKYVSILLTAYNTFQEDFVHGSSFCFQACLMIQINFLFVNNHTLALKLRMGDCHILFELLSH